MILHQRSLLLKQLSELEKLVSVVLKSSSNFVIESNAIFQMYFSKLASAVKDSLQIRLTRVVSSHPAGIVATGGRRLREIAPFGPPGK